MGNLKISTFNCNGFTSCDIKLLLEKSDIVCIQELWLSKQEINYEINNVSAIHHGFGVSPVDESSKFIHGRKYGGVAIMWNQTLDTMVEPLQLEEELGWISGIYLTVDRRKMLILNVYLPYERHNFECV